MDIADATDAICVDVEALVQGMTHELERMRIAKRTAHENTRIVLEAVTTSIRSARDRIIAALPKEDRVHNATDLTELCVERIDSGPNALGLNGIQTVAIWTGNTRLAAITLETHPSAANARFAIRRPNTMNESVDFRRLMLRISAILASLHPEHRRVEAELAALKSNTP